MNDDVKRKSSYLIIWKVLNLQSFVCKKQNYILKMNFNTLVNGMQDLQFLILLSFTHQCNHQMIISITLCRKKARRTPCDLRYSVHGFMMMMIGSEKCTNECTLHSGLHRTINKEAYWLSSVNTDTCYWNFSNFASAIYLVIWIYVAVRHWQTTQIFTRILNMADRLQISDQMTNMCVPINWSDVYRLQSDHFEL